MLIKRALNNILEGNLDEMRQNFSSALTTKAVEKLEERKIDIAKSYFGQMQEEVEQLDELKGTGSLGKILKYGLEAGHQIHHTEVPLEFSRDAEAQAAIKKIEKRQRGLQLADRKVHRKYIANKKKKK